MIKMRCQIGWMGLVMVGMFGSGGPRVDAALPEVYLGAAVLEKQVVFDGDSKVREPYLGVAADGTVLVMRNYDKRLRRSLDGGRTFGEVQEVPFGFLDSNFIVDDERGEVLVLRLWEGEDKLWRSADSGASWKQEAVTLHPNEVMKWMEREGVKRRGTRDQKELEGWYFLHNNASEAGLRLKHGAHAGRLIVTGTFRPLAKEHPSDRKPQDGIYSCAVFSDDGGKNWQVSGLFPDGTTEEAALTELSDGRLYFNSRSCSGFYDKQLARELRPDEIMRREAWSVDGGNTWGALRVSPVLIDGGGYGRGYGMKGGLVRLPIEGRDVLIYSNADTAGGERQRLTLWASFDGGQSWPVKRLVHEGHSGYSSLGAAPAGTADEGAIYLLFEGGETSVYHAMNFARLNLNWILEQAEPTGDGVLPDWVK
jgi:sialidase-1